MASLGSCHPRDDDCVLCPTSHNQESLDCCVDAVVNNNNNKKHAACDLMDNYDNDSTTASLAWSSPCSYDADCERSTSKNDFHAMEDGENHHHHQFGSSGNSRAVHVPAHVQLVLTTNPWFSSLPPSSSSSSSLPSSSSPTTATTTTRMSTNDDCVSTNRLLSSTTSNKSHAARRRRRRRRQRVAAAAAAGVGGKRNNTNTHRGCIVHCRQSSSSTSWASSSSSLMQSQQENDDDGQTQSQTANPVISTTTTTTTRSATTSSVAKQQAQEDEWSSEQQSWHPQDKQDRDRHTNKIDDHDDACSRSSIPCQVHVSSPGLLCDHEVDENSDVQDEATISTVGGGDNVMATSGAVMITTASPFQVALAAFLSRFETPTATTGAAAADSSNSCDDDDDDDSLSMDDDDDSAMHRVGRDENDSDKPTERSEDCSKDSPSGQQQGNDTVQTATTTGSATLVDQVLPMQEELLTQRDDIQQPVILSEETTMKLRVGPLVGPDVGLLVAHSTEDGKLVIQSSIVKKEEPPVLVVKTIESESSTRQTGPSMHVSSQWHKSIAVDNTSPAVDDKSLAAAGGMFDDIWSSNGLGQSLFSWGSTNNPWGTQENDSNQDDGLDDSADNSIPFRVAESVLAETDDSHVDIQGHANYPPGFNSAPPNHADVSVNGVPSSVRSESYDPMTDAEIRVVDHNDFPEPSSLEQLMKAMGVNRWHGQWKKIKIDGSAFAALPQPYDQSCLLWAVLNMKEPWTLILNGSCGTFMQRPTCSSRWSDLVLRSDHRCFRPLTGKLRCFAFGGFCLYSYAHAFDLAYSFRRLLVWNRATHLKTLQLGPFHPAVTVVCPPYVDTGALDPFLRLMSDLNHVPKLTLVGFGGGRLVGHVALGDLILSRCTQPGMLGPIGSTICLTGLGLDNGHCRVIADALAARPTWLETLDLSNNPDIGDEGLNYFNTLFHDKARGHFSSTFSIIVDHGEWMHASA